MENDCTECQALLPEIQANEGKTYEASIEAGALHPKTGAQTSEKRRRWRDALGDGEDADTDVDDSGHSGKHVQLWLEAIQWNWGVRAEETAVSG